MLIDIFRHHSKDPLQQFASKVQHLLRAESCAIFRVVDGLPPKLRLVGQSSDNEYEDEHDVSIAIQSVRKAGLTGHLAKKGKVTVLYGKELRDHPYRGSNRALHLKDKTDYSLLALPLKNRKNQIIGLIKVQNKKDSRGRPSPRMRFSSEDLVVAGTLASRLELAFESSHILTTIEQLLGMQARAFGMQPPLEEILRISLLLIRANRGDLALFDQKRNKLIVVVDHGPGRLEAGWKVHRRSVIGSVWQSGKPVRITNVRAYKEPYKSVHEATRSELAVPLRHESAKDSGGLIGVLNAESFAVGAFDEGDQALLQVVAESLANLIVGGPERSLGDALAGLAYRSDVSESVLASHLNFVRAAYGFDSGLLYLADETTKELRLSAQMGCDHLNVRTGDYTHQMGQKSSLAARVFRLGRPLYSRNPRRDPRVYREGLQTFRIEGPMLAVPLVYSGRVLGVLVTWSRLGPRPEKRHTVELMPFAYVAAATIAKSLAEREITHAVDEAVHDLVLPCGSLLDLSRQLEAGQLQESRRRIALSDLTSDAERILRSVEQILELHRHQKSLMTRGEFCLGEVVQNRVEKFRPRVDKGIIIKIERPECKLTVSADSHRIGSVVDNLLSNAVRYSSSGHEVLVIIAIESNGYRVSVVDEGLGVAPQNAIDIFKPNVSIPVPGQAPGSGLGLAIAHGVMLDHGGTLAYRPNPTGHGSIFHFFLPSEMN